VSPVHEAAFDLLESKLRSPQVRRGTVPRTALIATLNGEARATPVVFLSAGAGWGKTTLLAQWADESGRPFAWVSVDERDNDPIVLLTYVAAALDRVAPLDPAVFEALASPGTSVEGALVPRLGAVLATLKEPIVLVLDDLHLVENPRALDAIAALARHVAEDSQLVLSARGEPAVPLAVWRARGLAFEVGPDDLRMDADESGRLLNAAGVELAVGDVSELAERTEGWPGGLYLAALSARARGQGHSGIDGFGGSDRAVVDYLRAELLAYLPADEIRFLTRTAVLERMSGSLCDAVLESTGSAQALESLERSNLFLVPLDRERQWYRYHHLFKELLRSELERAEPELVNELLCRAADWCVANGQPEAAIGYAMEAGETERLAFLVEQHAQAVYQSGRVATVGRWFEWLEHRQALERNAGVAVLGAMVAAIHGGPAASDRWADAAENGVREGVLPDGSPSIDSWLAVLRAVRCRSGAARMCQDAAIAAESLARRSQFRSTALLCLGLARWLSGESEEADDLFADAVEEGLELEASEPVVVALGERAALAIERGAWVDAETLSGRALTIVRHARMTEYPTSILACAVAARVALHRGRAAQAGELMARAQRLRPRLTYALPHLAVQTRLELARACLTLADAAGAWTMLREVDAILRRQPDLGRLPAEVEELRSSLKTMHAHAPGASTLTAAELRVLPLLSTHLSFREIGDRVYLSRHTVKSHAAAIYRKLNVSSRDGAVERARELGLL
jgi:LuxR family maltose regulon positive regulatory protein